MFKVPFTLKPWLIKSKLVVQLFKSRAYLPEYAKMAVCCLSSFKHRFKSRFMVHTFESADKILKCV